MNKILTALVLAVLSLYPLSAQSYASLFETEAQASMRSSVEALSSMDEAAAADFVREGFRSRGLDVLDSTDDSSFGIASPEGDTLVRHNALAWIPGFDKSLEGCILVFWSWERYTGYARKCLDVRHAYFTETEALLTKQDRVFATQCDILLTAEEVKHAPDLQEAVSEALLKDSWKWTNRRFVEAMIENF